MKSIQLYINNQLDAGDLVELDLFQDEPIKLVDSIQNITDISKVFDTFTRDFKVPASPNNNRVFKGFANSKIINGFDSRVKIDAVIKVNGQDFKKGSVVLLSVGRENNGKASHYKLSFKGALSSIKEKLNDKKIKDLDFGTLRIPYTNANIVEGIRDGFFARGLGGELPQVTNITISATPNSSGTCILTLNGVAKNIFVSNDSTVNNALDIATIVNLDANYSASVYNNRVIIQSVSTSTQLESTFSTGTAIGMIAELSTLQWGGASDTKEQDKNGVELYPDIIYAPIFTDFKAVAVPYGSYSLNNLKPTNASYDFTLARYTGVGANNTSTKDDEDVDVDFNVEPVTPADYKPSVKVGRLLRMIANDFAIPFQDDFIHLEELDQLYMFFNGKSKSDTDSSTAAFNSNASTKTSGVSNIAYSKTFTTEVTPRGNETSFTGASNLDLIVPTATFFGWRQATRSSAVVYETESSNENNRTYRISSYYYRRDGVKVILNSTDYDPESGNGFGYTKVQHFDPRYTYDYFIDNVAGRNIFYEVTVTSTDDILTGLVDIKLTLKSLINFTSTTDTFSQTATSDTEVITDGYFNIERLAPEISCVDFLTGIFKMFNLTAYENNEGEIVVQKLATFYDEGNTIDITSSIITDKNQSDSIGFKYKAVDMSFQDADDVLTKNYSPLTKSTGFGNIKIGRNDFLDTDDITQGEGTGKTFSIELPFQSMMFEQLALSFKGVSPFSSTGGIFSTSVDGLPTDMVIGNCIDENLEGIDTKPILFYGKKVDQLSTYSSTSSTANKITNLAGRLYTSPVSYVESGNTAGKIGKSVNGRGYIIPRSTELESDNDYGLTTVLAFRDGASSIGDDNPERWWNPSGIMASRFRRNGVTPINHSNYFTSCRFDNDNFDENEFINEYPSQDFIQGLYQVNYEDYLKNMFKKNARLSKFKVKFNKRLLNTYKLNDTFIIEDSPYTINKIEIDILTGEGTVELLNKLDLPTGTPSYDANA